MISGFEFSKADLFSKYVDTFYKIKSTSSGASKFIAKLHLNSLYGIFGRKLQTNSVVVLHKNDLPEFLVTNLVSTIIEISDDFIAVKIGNNHRSDILTELNSQFTIIGAPYGSDKQQGTPPYGGVKSNVAIASAITSYARIHMIPYKLLQGTAYSDTDSIFTTEKLPDHLIGDSLGLMKDETRTG